MSVASTGSRLAAAISTSTCCYTSLRLRAYAVIDLKYDSDQPNIGLILCEDHDRLLAEYSFSGIDKPIGISTYELTRALPNDFQSQLVWQTWRRVTGAIQRGNQNDLNGRRQECWTALTV